MARSRWICIVWCITCGHSHMADSSLGTWSGEGKSITFLHLTCNSMKPTENVSLQCWSQLPRARGFPMMKIHYEFQFVNFSFKKLLIFFPKLLWPFGCSTLQESSSWQWEIPFAPKPPSRIQFTSEPWTIAAAFHYVSECLNMSRPRRKKKKNSEPSHLR